MRRAQDRARSATIESRALGGSNVRAAREARNENVPAKRADFFHFIRPLLSLLPTTIHMAKNTPKLQSLEQNNFLK